MLLAQAILDEYLEPVVNKCVTEALKGNVRALGLCMERILPPLREPGVQLKLPMGKKLKDLETMAWKVLQGIAAGNVTPAEAQNITNVLDHQRRVLEVTELEPRIQELERRTKRGRSVR